MRFGNFVHIVAGNLLERKGRTLSAILIVAFAAAVVTVVIAASRGFLSEMVRKAEEALPPDVLLVKPKSMDVAMLSFSAGGLTRESVERIRRLPGVEFVSPQLALRMPLRASGSVMGQSAETDAVVVGIDPQIVKDDAFDGFTFEAPAGFDQEGGTSEPVPTIVPRFFLDMYNLAYAESVGLPKINESFVRGKEITLHLGETYLLGSAGGKEGKTREVNLRIVGMTSNPSLMSGLMIPLSVAESLNRWYTEKKTDRYNAAHVKVGTPARFDEVMEAIREMGLVVESQRERLDQIRFAARAAMLTVGAFAVVIFIIAAVSILNTFALIMNERRGEVGLLRAVGATQRKVLALYLAEVAIIGLAGGIVGTLASLVLLRYGNREILERLPRITYLPDVIFRTDAALPILVIAASALVCLVVTFPIVRAQARISPAQTSVE